VQRYTALTLTTDFAAAPASTSTITMASDKTAVIALGQHVRYTQTSGDWVANTAVVIGDICKPTSGNAAGYLYRATANATTTNGAAPTWTQTPGAVIADNGVNWVCCYAVRHAIAHALAANLMTIHGMPLLSGTTAGFIATISALEYDMLSCEQLELCVSGNVGDSATAQLIYDDTPANEWWRMDKYWICEISAYMKVEDTGANDDRFNLTVNVTPAELIPVAADRDFSSDSGNWTKGANWTITGGSAHHATGNTATLDYSTGQFAPIAGHKYLVGFSIVTSTTAGGGLTPILGATSGTNVSALGRYVQVITATDTTLLKFTVPSGTWVGAIDDISVIELTAGVLTTNTNAGLAPTNTVAQSVVDLDQSKCAVNRGDRIEITCDGNGSNHDAQDLTMTVILARN